MTAMAFALFLWVVSTFWSEGKRFLWESLPSEAAAVFEDLVQWVKDNGIS